QNVVVEKINTLVVGNNDAIGNAGADAAAIFASGADMDISVNNLVLVQGGAGDDALATIAAVGDQAITVQNGDLRVVGGSGESSGAAISSEGLVQTITVANGNLVVQGNQTATGTRGATSTVLVPIAA